MTLDFNYSPGETLPTMSPEAEINQLEFETTRKISNILSDARVNAGEAKALAICRGGITAFYAAMAVYGGEREAKQFLGRLTFQTDYADIRCMANEEVPFLP